MIEGRMIWRNCSRRVGGLCSRIGRLLPVLAILCASNLASAEVGIQNPATRPGKNNFGGAVHKHAGMVARAKQGNCDLLFLGDSITDFWKKPVWDKYFGHLKALNFGISADRTEHVIWRIQNGTLDGIKPKLIVLMIGTNNIKSGDVRVPPPYVLEGVQAVIDEIFKRLPNTKILLMGILPRQPNYDWIADTIREANVLLKSLAEHEQIWFMDISDQFLNEDGTLKGLNADMLHPNEEGYEIWGRSIVGKVHELMGVELPEKFAAPGNYPACYPPIQWCREHNLQWTAKPGDKRLAGLREIAPVRKLKRDGLIYTLDCDGTLEVWGEQDTKRIEKMRIWKRRGNKNNCECALWATADHLYARQCGEDSTRVVLTLGRDPKEIWSYSTKGKTATDYIGEFIHVVGDGKALYAFGGTTHSEPVPPPPALDITASAESPDAKLPTVELSVGTSITSWVFTARSETGKTDPAQLTAKGVWSHKRFTAGWPAVDLTKMYDRSTSVEFVLSTVLHVPEATTLGWGLFTPAGEIWNRPDRITATFRVQKTEVPPETLLKLSPGYYTLTLELERAAMGGTGKIWIGPHFTAGPRAKEIEAAAAKYEADKKHWKKHADTRRETFEVGPGTAAADSNR